MSGYNHPEWVGMLRFRQDFGDIQEYEVSAVNQPAHHSEAQEVPRYSLDGQRLTAPVKGLNIVRYSDGTIKKEAVH